MRLAFDFTYPWALAGIAGLALIWWGARGSLAPLSSGRRRWSWALRSLLVILVGLALADPRWLRQTDRQHVLWLVDASRSVGREGVNAALKFIAAANQPRPLADQSRAAFAGSAAMLADTAALQALNPATLDDTRTDIAQALSFADANFPPGFNKTIVLFSDGVETSGDVAGLTATLRARGLRMHTVLVTPPDNPEVLVRSVTAPPVVAQGEPFRVTTEIVSNRDEAAELDLFRNAVKAGTLQVQLHKGVNRFETTQSASDAKLLEFVAQVRAPEDTLADNNSASTVVQSRGKSRVLLLTDKPPLSRYLALALGQEDVALDIRPPSGAPDDYADVQSYDLVIMDNVPATDLTPAQMRLLASYVRDFGGGLIMLGGDKSFGLGGYFRTPIEDILPVSCDFQKDKENPSLGLLLVIDRSGSMEGPKVEMAKEAAKAAVDLLSPQDYVGVIAFDTEAYWVSPMQSAADKVGIEGRISTITPGGGTNFAPGLIMAEEALRSTPAKLKHVVLMTDGLTIPGPFYDLVTKLTGEQVTVSAVGVGTDADQAFLQQFAEWGHGRYYYTDNPGSIPQIFARETMIASKSSLQESPFQAKVVRNADFLTGIPWDTSPYLLGQVLVKVKPTAELWLVSDHGQPLLATWRYGLGQAAAFTSDARNRWAVEWLHWEGFGRFWAQLARRLRRPAALKNFPATVTPENNGFRLRLDAVNEAGAFLSDLTGEAMVMGPDGTSRKYPLELTGPGQFEMFWPAPARGTYHAQLLLKRGDQIVDQQYASGTVGYPDEFSLKPPDEASMRALAAATGGKYNPAPGEILDGAPRQADVERELWPWLIAAATLLFLADVATRRWPEREPRVGALPTGRKTRPTPSAAKG